MKEIRSKIGGAVIRTTIVAWFVLSVASAQDRYMWTGVRIREGKREGKAVSAMNEAELRDAKRSDPAGALAKELAEIRLLADVDRKVEEASKRLEDLWIRASWELDYPGRLDVLVSVAKARAELFAKLGRGDDATKAVSRLLPDEAAKRAAPAYELVPASAKILEEEQRGLKDPRLTAGKGGLVATPQPSDEIEDAVVKAFRTNQYKVVEDIGSRAAPALEKLALANVDELVEANAEPLWFLFRLAPDRGAKFALENYDRGGFFWHKRILRSLMSLESSKIAEPSWTPVIRKMIDDPQLRQDALVLLNPLAAQNEVRPEIQDAIVRALDASNSDFAFQVTRQLSTFGGRESIQPILEKLLSSPIPDLRHIAGGMMQSYRSSPAMLRCVDHQDPEMRRLVASFLTMYLNHNPPQRKVVIDAQAREVLGKLATDADNGVRAQATQAIAQISEPLAPEVYTALARDGDEKILVEFDQILWFLSRHARESWSLAALAERRANPVRPMWASWSKEQLGELLVPFLQTKDGARTIVGWALEDADEKLFTAAIAKLPVEMPGSAGPAGMLDAWMSGDNGGLQALDDSMLERVYRRAFTTPGDELFPRIQTGLCNIRWSSSKPRTAALVPIVRDKTAPRELRACAARVCFADANVEDGAITSFILDECWSKAAPTNSETRNLNEIGRILQTQRRSAVSHRMLESKDAADAVAIQLFLGTMDAGGDPSLVRPVLDRWLAGFIAGPNEQPGLSRILSWSIQRIPAEHDEKASKDLLRALDAGRLRPGVIETMGRLRWPEFQGPLGELARNGDVGAVNALGGYMDDRTVEVLLEAIGRSPNEDFRKTCLAQLESIRKYQDEKSRWATRKNGQEAREETIAKLVPMLDDVDAKVRVQAILSLATLDAVEYLPKFIRLLNDKSPAVQQAAQQALDKLNGPREAKKP